MEVNPTSIFQATTFTSNILYRVQSSNCCGGHLGFRRIPQINSVQGLSDIKTISKCEANQTSGFQDIAFTSNCGWTNRHKDIRTDSAILYKYGTSFDGRIKTYQHISHFRHNASATWFVCLGFTLLFLVYITMVLACTVQQWYFDQCPATLECHTDTPPHHSTCI